MSNAIGGIAYAQYNDFDKYSYNCIKLLMEQDEVIWRMLKYNSPNAWNESECPNLTQEEKAALIYKGEDDAARYRVFMDIGQPDVWVHEMCNIRISPATIFPEGRTIGTVSLMFEVFAHYKINHLSDYTIRVDVVTKRFLQVFNGATVGGIGKLFFNRLGSEGNRLEAGGQMPYKGKWIIMSNKSP